MILDDEWEKRDDHGRWASGGAPNGDPSKEAAATRVVTGAGLVPRSQPVTTHADTKSMADGGRTVQQHLSSERQLALAARDKMVAEQGGRSEATAYGTSRSVLPSGHELYVSVKPRAANSRGANRGLHSRFEYNIRAPGEQYSHRIAEAKIAEHFKRGN